MVAAGVSLWIESTLAHVDVCIYIYISTFHRFDLRPAINSWLISLAWRGEKEGVKWENLFEFRDTENKCYRFTCSLISRVRRSVVRIVVDQSAPTSSRSSCSRINEDRIILSVSEQPRTSNSSTMARRAV